MIDLYKFCATDTNDSRGYLYHPHKIGEQMYATNGHILIAADLTGVAADIPDGVEVLPENVASIFVKYCSESPGDEAQWIPAGDAAVEPSGKTCMSCGGSGRTPQEVDCDDCDGDGDFWHGRHQYECRSCDGGGKVDGPVEDDDPVCEHCNGSGQQIGFWRLPWREGDGVCGRYVGLIQALPDAEFAQHGKARDRIHFRFTGGRGVVMPLIVGAPATTAAER